MEYGLQFWVSVSTLVVVVGVALTIGREWGKVTARMNDVWKIFPELLTAIDRVSILWRITEQLGISLALKQGFLKTHSDPALTNKGKKLLPPKMLEEIEALLSDHEIAIRSDPSAAIVYKLYDQLTSIAEENQCPIDCIIGVVKVYISTAQEQLSAKD